MNSIHSFFFGGHLTPTLNAINVISMPKMVGSQKVECFRPINLCNELYKIIPKLMANQFKVVSKKYIGDEQNDFLKSN